MKHLTATLIAGPLALGFACLAVVLYTIGTGETVTLRVDAIALFLAVLNFAISATVFIIKHLNGTVKELRTDIRFLSGRRIMPWRQLLDTDPTRSPFTIGQTYEFGEYVGRVTVTGTYVFKTTQTHDGKALVNLVSKWEEETIQYLLTTKRETSQCQKD